MILSLGVLTTNTTDGVTAWEIRTGATPGRVKLLEIGITLAAATATTIGIGYPQAIGITPTSPVDFEPEDPDDVLATGVIQSSLAWATPPTIPTEFRRRMSFPATIGTGIVWTFPKGLVIPVSSSIVVWNLATNSALNCYAVLEV